MSNSRDEESRGTNAGPDKSYAVGNKKPPLHSRFKQGKSGNPRGRPKGRTNFDKTLLKEFYKPVSATINGKPIKVTNDKLFEPVSAFRCRKGQERCLSGVSSCCVHPRDK
jgi:hypothetical protein